MRLSPTVLVLCLAPVAACGDDRRDELGAVDAGSASIDAAPTIDAFVPEITFERSGTPAWETVGWTVFSGNQIIETLKEVLGDRHVFVPRENGSSPASRATTACASMSSRARRRGTDGRSPSR